MHHAWTTLCDWAPIILARDGGKWYVHLDPGSHMGEALFGLIMTLTFTTRGRSRHPGGGREGARQMLIGILGCRRLRTALERI